MTKPLLADLTVGALNAAGLQVREVYARKLHSYGVYRTEKRVEVQYADDATEGEGQRRDLAPLGMLRSEINGLIDGWRRSERHRARARTKLFDRQCADALICALEGDIASATRQLAAIRRTIFEGRTALARFQYLGTAFAMVTATYLILWLASFPAISSSVVTTRFTQNVLIAVAGGALGAFLSITIVLKGRTVLPDLQWVANLSDAVLRMTVGIVAAAILICLIRGGFGIALGTVGEPLGDEAWMKIFAIGVFAGFFERLVPDLLEKTGAATRSAAPVETSPTPTPTPTPAATSGGSTAGTPATSGAAPAPDRDAVGDCLCDHPVSDAEATPDHALPPTTGGVTEGAR